MKNARYINLLVGLLLIAPAVVFVQQFLNVPTLKPLKGAFKKEAHATLNDSTWFTGAFQQQFEKSMNQQFGYRSAFVRLRNQLLYTGFHQSGNDGILRFKNGMLMSPQYLNTYLGKDFKGTAHFKERVERLTQINRYLKDRDKLLMVVLAPDKATYFPDEFGLPPMNEVDSTNDRVLLDLLDKNNIAFIDFRTHFLEKKSSTKAPLFSKRGIHWTDYGVKYAFDSISGFIEHNTNWQMPRLVIDKERFSTENMPIEYDLEEPLNLLSHQSGERLFYPESHWTATDSLPRMLIISDRFFFHAYSSGLAQNIMYDSQFWFYNTRSLKFSDPTLSKVPDDQPLDSLINHTDVVWLMTTSTNLPDFPWLFDKRFEKEVIKTN